MQELNLDVAGEFLVMAATLIHIKSRMLLPRPDPTQEDPEEDPREALVRRLLEHQKFKAAAELLHERETLRSAQWTRAGRPDRGDRRRGAGAGDRSRSLQPDQRLPQRRRTGEAAAEDLSARASRSRSRIGSSSCSRSCPETEACGFEDLFATCRRARGDDRHVPGDAGDDRLKLIRVFQSGAGADSRLQARAAGRRAQAARRSGNHGKGRTHGECRTT